MCGCHYTTHIHFTVDIYSTKISLLRVKIEYKINPGEKISHLYIFFYKGRVCNPAFLADFFSKISHLGSEKLSSVAG